MNIGGTETVTLDFEVVDDNIHELEEGLYLVATPSPNNNPSDISNSVQIRNGVALITIFSDDSKYYGHHVHLDLGHFGSLEI